MYVPSLCRDRHRAVETMRFSTSLCPSPAATCSRSPKPISSPGIYLLPFPLSLSLFRRHPMTTVSCPNERSRELSPGPSAPFSKRNHHHRIRITYTERISDWAILFCRCILLLDVHARSHAHDSRPGGRFQSGGVDEDDEENGGSGNHDDGPC